MSQKGCGKVKIVFKVVIGDSDGFPQGSQSEIKIPARSASLRAGSVPAKKPQGEGRGIRFDEIAKG